MGDKKRGLYGKFNITRTDGSSEPGGKHEECHYFVLDFNHDPFAFPALEAYADACKQDGYDQLAADLREKIEIHRDAWEWPRRKTPYDQEK